MFYQGKFCLGFNCCFNCVICFSRFCIRRHWFPYSFDVVLDKFRVARDVYKVSNSKINCFNCSSIDYGGGGNSDCSLVNCSLSWFDCCCCANCDCC